MSTDSLVSICIPTYNQTKFLSRSFDAICAQTYRNFEVVVTDDSTTPDVEKLIETYRGRLNIRYHKNPKRLGSPANWNQALSLASGDLIKFVHHDDWLAQPSSLETFVDEFHKNTNVDFVFCTSEVFNVAAGTSAYNRPLPSFLKKIGNDPRRLFNNNLVGSPTAVMFRKSLERFDENIHYVVDIDFYIRLLSINPRFSFIALPLIVNTSNHPGQVTATSLDKLTQVTEYCYLYNKVYRGKIPPVEILRFFAGLFRKFGIRSMRDLSRLSAPIPSPAWLFKILILLSR